MQVLMELDDRAVQRALSYAMGALPNTGPLMRTLANAQLRSTMRNFETESFEGHKWPRLAESTANRYIRSAPELIADYALSGRGDVGKYARRLLAQRARDRRRGIARLTGRNRRRGGANILHPTGRHIKQRIHQSYTKDEARVSSGTDWAWVHNFGAHMRRVTMPQRTFLGITGADRANIIRAAQYHVEKAF